MTTIHAIRVPKWVDEPDDLVTACGKVSAQSLPHDELRNVTCKNCIRALGSPGSKTEERRIQ